MNSDTIAAVATALSDSGIGIIRISGDTAVETADKIFRTPGGRQILENVESHTIHYGYIVDESISDKNDSDNNFIVDEVMVSIMRKPKSFTAEDTVEINCHGGILVMQKILELVYKNGARLAEPGEFTKRAFLNGRIDLSRAEAVMDVIHSQNELALKSSMNQLQGKLSECIKDLRKKLIYEIAFIESAIDDPEHISLDGYSSELRIKIINIRENINELIQTADDGRLIKEGISTVIIGKPNAGKSSLLNMLVGQERAIVTDVAGTTRDIIKESIRLHGICLNIVDTAGIHDTDDLVEKIGVEKAKQYAEEADLILCVVDTSVELDDSDREIFSLMDNKKAIVLLNKTDLNQKVDESQIKSSEDHIIVRTSTKDGSGIEELENAVKKMFFDDNNKLYFKSSSDQPIITNIRHKNALMNAYESLGMVLNTIDNDLPEDFYSIDLMSAYTSLGLIIGEEVDDDLMDEIFSKFCLGK